MPAPLTNPARLRNDRVTARLRSIASEIVKHRDEEPLNWRPDLDSLGFVIEESEWTRLRTNLASAFGTIASTPKQKYRASVKLQRSTGEIQVAFVKIGSKARTDTADWI
jgi:hypothetical protein